MTIKELIEWCDDRVDNHNGLKLVWEGGNDSGWIRLTDLHGVEINNKEADWLVEEMDNTLDYGSWAGDFDANGEAIYSKETKCFEGTNYYSTSESDSKSIIPARIVIPKKIYFTDLIISTADNNTVSVSASFENGFAHPSLDAILNKASQTIEKSVAKSLKEDEVLTEEEYIINFSEFKEDSSNKDNIEHVFDTVNYIDQETEEDEVTINLKDDFEEDLEIL
jgi:hypothetical protein